MRSCLEPGCPALTQRTRCAAHQSQRDRERNASPERDIYRGTWRATSRRLRAEQPWCSACGSVDDLTVDHGGAGVLCRSCHLRIENRRRGASRSLAP